MLLAHSSGLPAYEKLFEVAGSRDELVRAALTTRLVAEPGTRAEYSDIGFILLGEVLSRQAGLALDRFARQEIFIPLGMTHTRFNPPPEWKPQIPPTEDDRTFRRRIIQGEVNDENAFVMGGVAGHAGVFAPAIDIARFAECMLRGGAPDPQAGNRTALHASRRFSCRFVACAGMGHSVAAGLVGHSFFGGVLWSSRIHRHLPMDRSHAPAFGDVADQPHLAQPHVAGHPPGPASGARCHRRGAGGVSDKAFVAKNFRREASHFPQVSCCPPAKRRVKFPRCSGSGPSVGIQAVHNDPGVVFAPL